MTKKRKEELLKELESLKERLNELENADLEQKKVIEALSESEAKYRLLFDAAPVGIGIADLEGNIIDANRTMQEMSGFSLEEYRKIGVGATYADPEERKILLESLREKGKVRDWEGRLKRKDGSQYQALLNADIMELGGCKVVLGIIRDISENKRIELALNAAYGNAKDEKNKSEAIISALGDGIIIQDIDYKIIYQNQVQNDIYGDRTGELCYRTYEGRDEICEDCPVERTFRDGKIHRSEKKVSIDNVYSYFELTSSPLKDSTGKIIAGIKIVRDITESKRAEEKLREGERFLENIFTSIQDGIGIIDRDMNIIGVNKTVEIWYPYAAPLIGKKCYEAFHSRKERCELCPAWETLKTGKSAYKVVPKHGLEGKEVGWLEIYSYPLNDTATDEIKGVIEYVRDITELKRAEEALRKSEEKFRGIFEQSPIAIELYDWEGNLIDANRSCLALFGINDIKSVLGFKLFEDPNIAEDKKKRLSNGASIEFESIFDFELVKKARLYETTKSGKCYLDILIVPLITEERERYGYLVHSKDITGRKGVEEELKQSEEKYRLLIENIQEGVFVIQDARMQFANQAFAEITGYNIDEIIGMDFSHFVAPEDLKMVQDRYYRRQKGEEVPREYEFHVLRKDGEKTLVNMSVGIVTYRGRVASMGILRDITELKRAETLIKESEKKYRDLVELTTDIIYLSDINGNQVFINDAGYDILEAIPEEVIGQQWSKWLYPEDREKSFKKFKEMLDKGIDVFDFENRYLSKSGRVINVLHNIRILRNEKGVVIGTQGIARDITERKRIEESLKLFSEAVESAPDGIQIVDHEGHIKYSNKAVEKIYGFSHDELIGKNVGELNADPEIAEEIIKGIIEKGSWAGELIVRHKDGHEFPIWLTTSLVKDETGVPIAMVGIIRDISERKHAQEALALSNLKLEESNRTKELFTDIMHHDLLNPINVAHGYVEIFLEDETNSLKRSYLETIKRNLVKGIELIDNATKFSKLESMQNIEFEDLDLKKVVNEAIENLTPLALKANIRIENGLKGKMPARANKIIEDVFSNLISNAIKYAPHGKKIVVDGKDVKSSWLIRVMDFGPGIKDNDKKLVFERFKRGDKKGIKGSGLGLAIARKIVGHHKGSIWVEDNPEGGAIFVVEIPKS